MVIAARDAQVEMAADPEKKALAEKLVREEKARWKAEWLEGQRIKKCVWRINPTFRCNHVSG